MLCPLCRAPIDKSKVLKKKLKEKEESAAPGLEAFASDLSDQKPFPETILAAPQGSAPIPITNVIHYDAPAPSFLPPGGANPEPIMMANNDQERP